MATASAARPARAEGSGPGAGFLFGNIDNRGRLEEDYMDEDAKDCIDNVGPQMAEQHKDLGDIVRSAPRRVNEDDEDYDEDEDEQGMGGRPKQAGVDYYDEEDEADEEERNKMAKAVLKAREVKTKESLPASGLVADDDDNYDEDDEEPGKPVQAGGNRLDITESSPQVPSGTAAKGVESDSLTMAVTALASEQKALMRKAREQALVPQPTVVDKKPFFPEGQQLKFSQVFRMPEKRMRMVPKRRRYGMSLDNKQDKLRFSRDYREVLCSKEYFPPVDPVTLFIDSDVVRKSPLEEEAIQREELLQRMRKKQASPENEAEKEDFEESAQPLSTSALRLHPLAHPEAAHSMIEQTSWEDNICWKSDNDNDDEFYGQDDPEEADHTSNDNRDDVGMEMEVDDDSDDDMMWEDGNVKASTSSSQPPVETANAELKAVSSPRPKDLGTSRTLGASPTESTPQNNSTLSIKHPLGPSSPQDHLEAPSASQRGAPDMMTEQTAQTSKPKVVTFAPDTKFASNSSQIDRSNHDRVSNGAVPVLADFDPHSFIKTPLTENRDLSEGKWLLDVIWDSDVDDYFESPDEVFDEHRKLPGRKCSGGVARRGKHMTRPLHGLFDGLILDSNDPNMVFTWSESSDISHSSEEFRYAKMEPLREGLPKLREGSIAPPSDQFSELKMKASGISLGPRLDLFDVSLDKFYTSPSSTHTKAVAQTSVLKTLHHAPPAIKAQTTLSVLSSDALVYFRQPLVTPVRDMLLTPFRRKRPKGGPSQIAGLVPKKRSDLSCGAKDAYRVVLFEYALERCPPILPVPGMATRIVTYRRAASAAKKQELITKSAGTADAETIYLAPYEPPPLHAGDLQVDQSIKVVESRIFGAPCAHDTVAPSDFLVVRKGSKMYVREIDGLVSVGVTEPRMEVMPPNTDRFKKYARDRVMLWIVREFMRQRKKLAASPGTSLGTPQVPHVSKERLLDEFNRKRTYPETSVIKILKELAKYSNGRYVMNEPVKGFPALERELLRTINPEETAAFEAMEAGWEELINSGINHFTHPTTQGNVLGAAEKIAINDGPKIGSFIRTQLLRSAWYRTQIALAAQKQQEKELAVALKVAVMMNELREGGEVMEARLRNLTAAQASQILISEFRIYSKKIPNDLESRRQLIRDCLLNRKNNTVSSLGGRSRGRGKVKYGDVIQEVIVKQRSASRSGVSGATAAVAAGGAMVIPLEAQLRALEQGDIEDIPTEEERISRGDAAAIAVSKTAVGHGGGLTKDNLSKGKKKPSGKPVQNSRPLPSFEQVDPKTSTQGKPEKRKKSAVRQGTTPIVNRTSPDDMRVRMTTAEEEETERKDFEKLMSSSIARGVHEPLGASGSTPASATRTPGEKSKKKISKKVRRLRVVKKVVDPVTGEKKSSITYVDDPAEIERILATRKTSADRKQAVHDGSSSKPKLGSSDDRKGDGRAAKRGNLKIAINMNLLSRGSKISIKNRHDSRSKIKKTSSGKRRKDNGFEKGIEDAFKKQKSFSKTSGGDASLRESQEERFGGKDVDGVPGLLGKQPKRQRSKGAGGVRKIGGKKQVGKIKIDTKKIQAHKESQALKRRRSQYGDDLKYPRKKARTTGGSSRRKRNGAVVLNGILEKVEKAVRNAQGYIASSTPKMKIMRLKEGEILPFGAALPTNLACPKNTGLDFTCPVNPKTTPRYREIIKKPMYLDLIKHKAKKMQYTTAQEFMDDMDLLVNNARLFNSTPDVEWVVQHAELLREVAEEELREKADDIKSAEEVIRKEKSGMNGTTAVGKSQPVSNGGTRSDAQPTLSPSVLPSPELPSTTLEESVTRRGEPVGDFRIMAASPPVVD